jgi:hypothetical protein
MLHDPTIYLPDTNKNCSISYTAVTKKRVVKTTGTEPVLLAQAKDKCRIDTTDFDTLITRLISVAREQVEQKFSTCLIDKQVQVTVTPHTTLPFTNGCEYYVIDIEDENCEAVDLEYNQLSGMGKYKVTYDVKSNVTYTMQEKVLQQVAYLYENPGDSTDTIKPTSPML